jgi:hydrogenase nickel incorporation protein HypB
MCAICGCSTTDLEHEHHHDHPHAHGPGHTHENGHNGGQSRTIRLEQDVLAKNNRLAERNRGWLQARQVFALNLVSSPGSGKTTLLERTIIDLKSELAISVIEGDQETALDAQRIRATGSAVIQINTGSVCHLDAEMVDRGLKALDPKAGSMVMIENVGNLVCPALFDLGEHAKVVIMSVTEGEDKPLKYPHMFRASQLMILSKTDLLPHLKFDVDRCLDYAHRVNPKLRIFQLSSARGEGMSDWYGWLQSQLAVAHPEV